MKPVTKIIVYDDTCPLCAAYTNTFVQTGLLQKEGRQNFNSIDPVLFDLVDHKRSVNEIPLIDISTKQVWYGIDALLEVLSAKLPAIKSIGNFSPVKWFLSKLYKFISYNRRVIVAIKQPANGFDCTPDFNVRYRILFMAVFLLFNTCMLLPLQQQVLINSIFYSASIYQVQSVHTAIVAIDILLALSLGKIKGIEYLGQINMLALETILLILPLIIVNQFWQVRLLNDFYLGCILVFLTTEYIRRMKFAGVIHNNYGIVFINIASVTAMVLYLVYHQ